jgi:histidine triad (HIT) family protein
MENCLFCKIIHGEIPSARVFENDRVFAFRDINPQAPFHVLVVPKKHVASVAEIGELQDDEVAACLRAVAQIASEAGLSGGFRVISNCGPDACQSVPHLHFHILGGTQLAERMA